MVITFYSDAYWRLSKLKQIQRNRFQVLKFRLWYRLNLYSSWKICGLFQNYVIILAGISNYTDKILRQLINFIVIRCIYIFKNLTRIISSVWRSITISSSLLLFKRMRTISCIAAFIRILAKKVFYKHSPTEFFRTLRYLGQFKVRLNSISRSNYLEFILFHCLLRIRDKFVGLFCPTFVHCANFEIVYISSFYIDRDSFVLLII